MAKLLTPKWDPKLSPAANARRELPRLAAEYFEFGRGLVEAETAPAGLHTLRLATKRFRYTLELLRDLHGPALEDHIRALQKAQQLLGDTNDHVAAAALLSPRNRARQRLLDEADRLAEEFRRWWREEFEPQEEAWARYLARGAKDEAATPKPKPAAGNGKPARRRRPSPVK